MKKNTHFLLIAVLVLLSAMEYSCKKEFLKNDDEMPVLKKASMGDLSPMEMLGKEIYFDKISSPGSMSCANCHAPEVGFTGPIFGLNKMGSVYHGADPHRFGNRKPPSAAYATFSPVFHYDSGKGLFEGGNFWDGRATGEHYTGNSDAELLTMGLPSAEQAIGPFLNPVEMNNPSKEAVLMKIAGSKYAFLWEEVWDEPVNYTSEIERDYDRVGLSIAAYEASAEVNPFSSKYDAYLREDAKLTKQEVWGLKLFEDPDKGNCSACHPNSKDPQHGNMILFTDFTFDNLGVPKNPDNPFYGMDKVYLDDGSPINPDGADWIDLGLGGFLENHSNSEWRAMADANMGKHKVPTLRNVGKKNGNGSVKAYMHNGVFKSLKEVVHFYNTRDAEGFDWPAPEVKETVNHNELGDLGLSDKEEDAIVAFLMTLSDGYMKGK